MNDIKTLQKLRYRLTAEEKAYEAVQQEEEQYVSLPRKRYFSFSRRKSDITHKIAALKTAIEIFEKPFADVDVFQGCLMGLSDLRDDRDEILTMANAWALNHRAKAATVLFQTSLPIAKKEVLAKLVKFIMP